MSIRIGIGSWADDEYRGVLYPPGLKPADRLRHYATIFDHVEVNSTYYGAPKPDTVKKWINETPPGFLFDIKLHRVFSVSPKSANPAEGKRDLLGYTLECLAPLAAAKKLGVFLLLLTRFSPEKHTLAEVDTLVRRLKPFQLAIELRDPAWVTGKARKSTLDWFRDAGATLINVDMPRGPEFFPILDEVTNPKLAYFRFHGRNRAGYLKGGSAATQHHYKYKDAEIDELTKRIRKVAAKAKEVRVVFNNHAEDFAPRAALALKMRMSATAKSRDDK